MRANGSGRTSSCRYVEGRAAMFAGLADSTMSRDDAWRFMVLGRSIERVDMVVRLLLSRVADRVSSPGWVTVLRSAGAHDTYLRTYRGALDAGRVVEFLLMDRLFPRSVFYSLRQAEHCLDELRQPAHSRDRGEGRGAATARPCAQRAGVPAPGRAARDLEERLAGLQKTCATSAKPCRCSTSTPPRGWRGRDAGRNGSLVIEDGRSLMWRMRVVHSTGYATSRRCTESYNEARLTPRSDSRQNVILSRVETMPATRSYRYIDYWGTAVTAFDLHAPHTELAVDASSVVETDGRRDPGEDSSWEDLARTGSIDRFDEMLGPTHYVGRASGSGGSGGRSAKDDDPRRGRARRRGVGAQRTRLPARVPPACTRRRWRRSAKARASARTSRT